MPGGRVVSTGFGSTGTFFLEFDLASDVAPGSYRIPVTAKILNLEGVSETVETELVLNVTPRAGGVRLEARRAASALQLSWFDTGEAYRVETTARLAPLPVVWQPLATGNAILNGGRITIPVADIGGGGFFRVMSQKTPGNDADFGLSLLTGVSGVPGRVLTLTGHAQVPVGEVATLKVQLPWGTFPIPLAANPFAFEVRVPEGTAPGDYDYTAVLEGAGGKQATARRGLLLNRPFPSIDMLKATGASPGFPVEVSGYLSGGTGPYEMRLGAYFAPAQRGPFTLLLPGTKSIGPGVHSLEVVLIDSAGVRTTNVTEYSLLASQPLGTVIPNLAPGRRGEKLTVAGEVFGGLPPWTIQLQMPNGSVSGVLNADAGAPYKFTFSLLIPPATIPGPQVITCRVTDAAQSQIVKTLDVLVQE